MTPELVLTCAADERSSLPKAVMLYSAMRPTEGAASTCHQLSLISLFRQTKLWGDCMD